MRQGYEHESEKRSSTATFAFENSPENVSIAGALRPEYVRVLVDSLRRQ